jgi:hypothetical protein
MSACINCAVGKYTSSTQQTSCISCPTGKVQPNAGRTSCPDCAKGKHQTAAGQTECPICGAGKYAHVTGMVNCIACTATHNERAAGHGARTGVTWIRNPGDDEGKHDEASDCTAEGGKCDGNTDLNKVKITEPRAPPCVLQL